MKNSRFFKQAEFLLQILPFFKKEKSFALKGGTAINFFLRDLPRLSVDIDFTYLPVSDRAHSLKDISECLKRTTEQIKGRISGVRIIYKYLPNTENVTGIVFLKNNFSVKIEPNLVLRGSVFEPSELVLCKKAEDLFGLTFSFLSLSKEDLYGGKICAALDRQHPRDFFDIKQLLEKEGITENIRKAFLIYLISHSRPLVELLNPNFIDISAIYKNEFSGMSFKEISLDDLLITRQKLVKLIKDNLTDNDRQFILSVKKGEPQWELFEPGHIKELPAVKWKLANIKRMTIKKHEQAIEKLKIYLDL